MYITKLNKIATWEAAVLQQLCNSQALLHACTYTIIVCWNTSLFERWVSIGRDFPGVHGADANLIQGAMENIPWKWGGSDLMNKSQQPPRGSGDMLPQENLENMIPRESFGNLVTVSFRLLFTVCMHVLKKLKWQSQHLSKWRVVTWWCDRSPDSLPLPWPAL